MELKLYRVIVPVSDIEKAQSFYSKLFEMKGERVSPGRHYFTLGGTIMACLDPVVEKDSDTVVPNPEHIYISTDKINDMFLKLQILNPIEMENQIEMRPWGEKSFYFTDPFGNKVCIVDSKTIFTGTV